MTFERAIRLIGILVTLYIAIEYGFDAVLVVLQVIALIYATALLIACVLFPEKIAEWWKAKRWWPYGADK